MTEDPDRQQKFDQLAHLKQLGEKAYDDMYEVHSQHDVNSCYRDAKECFYDAIGLARRLGLNEEMAALEKRLAHIKAVFRSQFT